MKRSNRCLRQSWSESTSGFHPFSSGLTLGRLPIGASAAEGRKQMRKRYAAAAAILLGIEVWIALAVHDRFVRPFLGDTLAVILVYLLLRAATRLSVPAAAIAAMAIAFLIELGQLVGLLHMLGLARNPLARVVLGTGFDPKDFLAYLAGGVAAAGMEAVRNRLSRTARPAASTAATAPVSDAVQNT